MLTAQDIINAWRNTLAEVESTLFRRLRDKAPACEIKALETRRDQLRTDIERQYGSTATDHYDAAAERHDTSAA